MYKYGKMTTNYLLLWVSCLRNHQVNHFYLCDCFTNKLLFFFPSVRTSNYPLSLIRKFFKRHLLLWRHLQSSPDRLFENCAGIWSFLYYRERRYFFFPKIWSYTLDGKWKMIFLKKIHRNIFSSGFLKRWSFQKGSHRHMIFFVLSGKMVFFPQKHVISSLGRNWEAVFLRKYMEIWHFLCTRTGVTNVTPRPSVKRIKDGLILQKYTKRWWCSRLTS